MGGAWVVLAALLSMLLDVLTVWWTLLVLHLQWRARPCLVLDVAVRVNGGEGAGCQSHSTLLTMIPWGRTSRVQSR